ncbi:hypothetical protein [Rhizobium hidalgonense]|uniref:hypothetical protein n=1 Tax=Rhizobium hidalgonense TaxID=1538159 RepID=UPI001106297B|nr:hypothetical protein [Rhizobium hidalgonense]QKK27987.1 hypothetical protein FFM81_032340 [Rhizobium hidalgonense]
MVDRGGELFDTLRIEGGEFANPHDRYQLVRAGFRIAPEDQRGGNGGPVQGVKIDAHVAMSAWSILL